MIAWLLYKLSPKFRNDLAMQRLVSSYWQGFKFWTMRHHMYLRYINGIKHDVKEVQTFLNEMHAHKYNHTGRTP